MGSAGNGNVGGLLVMRGTGIVVKERTAEASAAQQSLVEGTVACVLIAPRTGAELQPVEEHKAADKTNHLGLVAHPDRRIVPTIRLRKDRRPDDDPPSDDIIWGQQGQNHEQTPLQTTDTVAATSREQGRTTRQETGTTKGNCAAKRRREASSLRKMQQQKLKQRMKKALGKIQKKLLHLED
ncbi:uncharacterized protein ColSpa_02386 [Colletotrichum spaethianum]|uniref:Uncharacterized protein n=1 Tax=Colletotrichum spaethianum TaxID=700344 RepID=A0AA37LA50_9PEZI|nr:uncharacterized protein ColSpa_02386 [Colletotrichum spaethianum]GKT42205.1 hypothetical protein ColSpa_02386 [Colletotrichum spaethianum]